MKFLVTPDIPTLVRDDLVAQWQFVVGPSECKELVQLSTEPSSFIRLVDEAVAWATPLRAAAVPFLVGFIHEFGKRSAAAVWNKGTETLRWLAALVIRARCNSPRHPAICLGLPFPPNGGAVMPVPPDTELEVARAIAWFVLSAETIETFVRKELRAGRMQDDTDVSLSLQEDGSFIVRWFDEGSGEDIERIIPAPRFPP